MSATGEPTHDTSPAPPPEALSIGQVLGSYRIVRKLGEGGMGSVYAAEHVQINYRAAVKVLHLEYSRQPEIARRFLNEARAVNIIQHPGIVKIFEFGRLPDKTTYIIMEYLDGEPLHKRLEKSGGRLTETLALRLTRQIASALQAAHERRVVHRDLKPANVMLVPDPEAEGKERAKILDFGLAKVAGEAGDSGTQTNLKTRSGVVMGTAMYMAPEQCRGARDLDGKTDVYALGCILYEMLAGRPPFVAPSEGELVTMHLRDAPPALSTLVPRASAEVVSLVHAMLAKDPARRPTMEQVEVEAARLGEVSKALPVLELPLSEEFGAPAGRRAAAPRTVRTVLLVSSMMTGLLALGWLLGTAPVPRRTAWRIAEGTPITRYALRALWALGPRDVWAAGDSGTALHFDGGAWKLVPTPTAESLRGLWAAARNDVWAVGGQGVVLRWNGMLWAEVDSGTKLDLRGIHGSAPKDIWAVGRQGLILHWDGAAWASVPSGIATDLRSVWSSGPGDAFAVGEYGIVHWDGTAWTKADSKTWLYKVWGTGPRDVFAVGNDSLILHFDGKAWTREDYSSPTPLLSGIWGTGPKNVFIVGNEGVILRFDGRTFAPEQSNISRWLFAVGGSDARNIWAVGLDGLILQRQ